MKKKVLHIVYGVLSGGVEQMIINYFSGEEFKEYELFLAYSGNPDLLCLNKLKALGFTTIQLKNKSFDKRIQYFFEIHSIMKKYKIDYVHSHINLDSYLPLLAAKLLGIKVRIAHAHGLAPYTKSIIKKSARETKKKLIRKLSTMRFSCSEKTGDYIFKKNNYVIVYNSIDIEKFKYNSKIRKEIRNNLNLNNKEVIGYIGRFNTEKNHIFLLDVFSEISKINDKAYLLLIGMGILQKQIENKIKDLNLSNKVLIITPKDNIYDYYQVMDLFVFPSEEEGLGMVAIESQVNNLYCFASTGVPKETKISKNIQFLDLNIGSEKWANIIIKKLHNRDNNELEKIDLNKFDINIQRKKLKRYYEKLGSGLNGKSKH